MMLRHCLFILLGCLCWNTLSAAEQKPNFVYFIADDISAEDFACYGHPVIKTPRIDELASSGMRFTNAYLTASSCSVSRCSIITGRYPHNTGAPELHSVLPDAQLPYPRLLREAGYYTVLAGKNHMAPLKDTFDLIANGKGDSGAEGWVPALQNRPKDKPFFMWFAAYDAHAGFSITADAPVYDPKDVVIPPYMYDAPGIRGQLAGYYHEVSRFDTFVGKVVDELRRQEVLDNTVIIVMADNGRPFTRCKTRVYDSGIKTPFVVHYPKLIKQAAITDSLISSIDVSATVLELAGIKKDERIQGQSFLSILQDPKARTRDLIFAEHNWHVNQAHERMVRIGDFLYIKNNYPNRRLWCVEATSFTKELQAAYAAGKLNDAQANVFRDPCPEEELFHVGKDPDQLTNLASNPEYAGILQSLRQQVETWTEETGDSVPTTPTPDRGSPGTKGETNPHREFPGASRNATAINKPGPIRLAAPIAP